MIEVGSGAHGLIFYFGSRTWNRRRSAGGQLRKPVSALATARANRRCGGESLPFPDQSFDVVICDNVVDHAESPARIVRELARILAPGGLLYFTVNIHHPVYAVAAGVHSSWRAVGVPYEVGPFADHTTHLTLTRRASCFADLPLRF